MPAIAVSSGKFLRKGGFFIAPHGSRTYPYPLIAHRFSRRFRTVVQEKGQATIVRFPFCHIWRSGSFRKLALALAATMWALAATGCDESALSQSQTADQTEQVAAAKTVGPPAAVNPSGCTAAPGGSHEACNHPPVDHAYQHPASDPAAPCTCAVARFRNGWCRKCNVGSIAGHRVESALLFATLDAHGHKLEPESFECDVCKAALDTDGYCEKCGRGYFGGYTYFTRLTYGLAQGPALDPSAIQCETCSTSNLQTHWCERCNRGMVGNVSIANRKTYDNAAREYLLLLSAIEKTKTCELCACAMVVHRVCPTCLIDFSGEKPLQLQRPPR